VRAAAGASVHLVALTGYGQPKDRDRSRAAGFDDHLTKPLDLAALDAIVARVSLIRS
jgi:CheY-like chemotaxis protein